MKTGDATSEERAMNATQRRRQLPTTSLAILLFVCAWLPFSKGCGCSNDVFVPSDVVARWAADPNWDSVPLLATMLWPFAFGGWVALIHLAMLVPGGIHPRRLRVLHLSWTALLGILLVILVVMEPEFDFAVLVYILLVIAPLFLGIWAKRLKAFRQWSGLDEPFGSTVGGSVPAPLQGNAQEHVADALIGLMLQAIWFVYGVIWYGGYMISPSLLLIGGKLSVLLQILLVESTRWQIIWLRSTQPMASYQISVRYILVWTTLVAIYLWWMSPIL